jgi:gamma-polyglutamate biosynthesis protein CapC
MIDLLTLSIAIGLVVSLLFAEMLGRVAGGLVVPGYIALNLTRPIDVVLTLVAALATYTLVQWLSSFLIVYGKRRTVLMLLAGFASGALIRWYLGWGLVDPQGSDYTVIGYIVPGLIAIWFDRQGLLDTCASLLTAAVVVRLLLVLFVPAELQLAEWKRTQSQLEARWSLAAPADREAGPGHAFGEDLVFPKRAVRLGAGLPTLPASGLEASSGRELRSLWYHRRNPLYHNAVRCGSSDRAEELELSQAAVISISRSGDCKALGRCRDGIAPSRSANRQVGDLVSREVRR